MVSKVNHLHIRRFLGQLTVNASRVSGGGLLTSLSHAASSRSRALIGWRYSSKASFFLLGRRGSRKSAPFRLKIRTASQCDIILIFSYFVPICFGQG